MKYEQTDKMELKSIYTQDLKKEIVAFLNTIGGKILIGVDDDGKVIGVENPKDIMQTIASLIHDSIKPDATTLCKITSKIESDKKIIEIDINRGTKKPYYLYDKGLKPSGVYIRLGNVSQPSTEDEIKSMLIEREKVPYELMVSFNQELTFNSLEEVFKREEIQVKYKTLMIVNNDELYTNLGYFLSDQNSISTKVAVFAKDDKSEFIDRKEFVGSLIKQVDDIYDYLKLNNKVKGTYNDLKRIDTQDYDNLVLREGILNAIIHRDYSLTGSNLINIFNNRIEFISIGGLIKSMTYQDMMLGISRSRNEFLAKVFFRLKYVEAYGTGIDKIMRSYSELKIKPLIKTSENGFLLSLPNKNTKCINSEKYIEEETVLEFIKENVKITRKEIQEHFGFKLSKAISILKHLESSGKINRIGNGKNIFYSPKNVD